MTEDAGYNENSEEIYSITQLCQEFGLTMRALRFYEQRKLLMPFRRGATRFFTRGDRIRLRLIMRGKRFGFALSEIKQMLDLYDPRDGGLGQLQAVLPKLQAQLGALRKEHATLGEVIAELEGTCEAFAGMLDGHKKKARK